MDVLAKGLLVVGALLLLAVTLAGLVFALRHMYESLEPYGGRPHAGGELA